MITIKYYRIFYLIILVIISYFSIKYVPGLIFIAIFLIGLIDYRCFNNQRKKIYSNFSTADTIYDQVKYIDLGSKDAPVILFSTGGGAGIDSAMTFDWLIDAGYRIIAVNRPGYYNMPVDIVDSIEGHAKIYYEVVKKLGIKEVNIFGLSMGGLSSLYYAQMYPVNSMVLWSPITGEYHPNKEAIKSPLGKLVMSDKAKNIISWMMARFADYFPKAMAASFLSTEADLSKKEINEIAKWVVQNPNEKRRMIQFVHSLTPMNQLFIGMMDEVEKASTNHTFNWEAIDMPVLAYGSIVDKDISRDHFDRLNNYLVNGELRFVKAGGHFCWWGDEGEIVQKETLKFFNTYTNK